MPGTTDSQNVRRRKLAKGNPALPLFMSAGRSRVSEPVIMSMSTAREMNRYVRWAAEAARVARDEAQAMMLDRAIWDYIKRDEAWQAEKASIPFEAADEQTADEGPPAQKAAPAPSRAPAPNPPRAIDGGGVDGGGTGNPGAKAK